MPSQKYILFVDGSSRGNPGPAGIGIAVFAGEDREHPIEQISKYIGITTNNVAEYEAVIQALKWIKSSSSKRTTIKLDSELVYKQLSGAYKVRSSHIAIQYKRVQRLREQIEEPRFILIPRSENTFADKLAQKASKMQKQPKQPFKQDEFIKKPG
jgi:ribonuclease HI